jgi:hypothetical protein
MDSNYNYRPKGQGQSKRGHLKDAHNMNGGSLSCSSDEEFHSDDNLRPYEEVKVAHQDKKLNGLGKCFTGKSLCVNTTSILDIMPVKVDGGLIHVGQDAPNSWQIVHICRFA